MRKAKLGLAILLLVGFVGQPGQAAPTCRLSGLNGEYKVAKLVMPYQQDLKFDWDQSRAFKFPGDENSYGIMLGFFIVNASTRKADRWILHVSGGSPPNGIARINGTTFFDGDLPGTGEVGVHGWEAGVTHMTLGPGTYYVVGFVWGVPDGFLGPIEWYIEADVGLACTPCPETECPGKIVKLDQAHFGGGTHIYAPGAGVGSRMSLTHATTCMLAPSTPCNTLLAGMFAYVEQFRPTPQSPWVGGTMKLHYVTPTGAAGDVGQATVARTALKELVSTNGTYSFTADYYGANPLILITALEVHLP